MDVIETNSKEACIHLRELLDAVMLGNYVIIERYTTPITVMIPFRDYEAIRERLEELHSS